ncbi:hypothetical protein IF2G_07084 [Cordyceps javanica]|nr:hypothetical protein IF2G_07084 [Cordyceps javanica]
MSDPRFCPRSAKTDAQRRQPIQCQTTTSVLERLLRAHLVLVGMRLSTLKPQNQLPAYDEHPHATAFAYGRYGHKGTSQDVVIRHHSPVDSKPTWSLLVEPSIPHPPYFTFLFCVSPRRHLTHLAHCQRQLLPMLLNWLAGTCAVASVGSPARRSALSRPWLLCLSRHHEPGLVSSWQLDSLWILLNILFPVNLAMSLASSYPCLQPGSSVASTLSVYIIV